MSYRYSRACVCSALLLGLAACSAKTQLSSVQPDSQILVKESKGQGNPREETFSTTSFGNYEFRIRQNDGKCLYGILPLKFNGGYLAADILFFAPAAFFNLREVYPYYQFDVDKGVVRYKNQPEASWQEYAPQASESSRAKTYFSTQQADGCQTQS